MSESGAERLPPSVPHYQQVVGYNFFAAPVFFIESCTATISIFHDDDFDNSLDKVIYY
jgi:hypothetical protein